MYLSFCCRSPLSCLDACYPSHTCHFQVYQCQQVQFGNQAKALGNFCRQTYVVPNLTAVFPFKLCLRDTDTELFSSSDLLLLPAHSSQFWIYFLISKLYPSFLLQPVLPTDCVYLDSGKSLLVCCLGFDICFIEN